MHWRDRQTGTEEILRFTVSGHSGGLFRYFGFCRFGDVDRNRAAQIGPIDIGAHFFAADGPIGSALDCWAAIGRNISGSVLPLRNNRWRHRDFAGQLNYFSWS